MESSSDDDVYSEKEDTSPKIFPETNKEASLYLKNLWETLSPPVPEKDLIDEWYAAVFYNKKKKGILYIGRVTMRFLADEDEPVESIELDCLKPAPSPSSTILEEPPTHLGKDIGRFSAYDLIAGPLKVEYRDGRKWNCAAYPSLFTFFQRVEKIQREEMFKLYVSP